MEVGSKIETDNSHTQNGIKLDELGPIIVNLDGTLSRIPNWHEMTEGEQQKTLRLIAIRNKKRITDLEKKLTTAEEADADRKDDKLASSEDDHILSIEN